MAGNPYDVSLWRDQNLIRETRYPPNISHKKSSAFSQCKSLIMGSGNPVEVISSHGEKHLSLHYLFSGGGVLQAIPCIGKHMARWFGYMGQRGRKRNGD